MEGLLLEVPLYRHASHCLGGQRVAIIMVFPQLSIQTAFESFISIMQVAEMAKLMTAYIRSVVKY